jgi:hypothetical protein
MEIMKRSAGVIFILAAIVFGATWALAQHHGHGGHGLGSHKKQGAGGDDTRVFVKFPASLVEHTLANMRDHLVALQEINEAMARGAFGAAGKIAEDRLGLSSLKRHGAHKVAKYMPQGMQDAGTAMHRAASRFALTAQEADVTGDYKSALRGLGDVMAACVGCHAGYKLR